LKYKTVALEMLTGAYSNTSETRALDDADFPRDYVDRKHPKDLIETFEPVRELILHKRPQHNRLILRMSFRVDDVFIPVSFVCDTGLPDSFYLCEEARRSRIGELIQTDELDNEFIRVNGKAFIVLDSPSGNSLGLKTLLYFGLTLTETGFDFSNLPSHV
jgi:hypothetical protein